nr:MAG TPA: hypothetical protein [Caudoviricetes sp.]
MLILKTNMTKQEIDTAVLENRRRRRTAVKEYREKKRTAKDTVAVLRACDRLAVELDRMRKKVKG